MRGGIRLALGMLLEVLLFSHCVFSLLSYPNTLVQLAMYDPLGS